MILDRRHGESAEQFDLKEDRRRQREVDVELEAKGFAIVPASVDLTGDGTSSSLLFPEVPIDQLPSIDQLSSEDDESEEFETARSFWRRPSGTQIAKLVGVLNGVTMAALVLSLAGQNIGQDLVNWLFQKPFAGRGQPGQTNESFTRAQSPALAEKPVVSESRPADQETSLDARPNDEALGPGGLPSTKSSISLRPGDGLAPEQRETNGASETTRSVFREPGSTSREISTTVKESRTPPRVAAAPSPAAEKSRATAQFVGVHRAKLVRKPISRGWGDSYAVRLLDPAGRPVVVAEVVLVAQMADGTVQNIAMGALPEPGTYRATVPTDRSTPVDLHVRIAIGDKLVDVPVGP
jgi:hypothetical protein